MSHSHNLQRYQPVRFTPGDDVPSYTQRPWNAWRVVLWLACIVAAALLLATVVEAAHGGKGTVYTEVVTVPSGLTTPFDYELKRTSPTVQAFNYQAASGSPHEFTAQTSGTKSYALTQTTPTGWELQSIACAEGTPGAQTIDLPGGKITFSLSQGEHVTCTFTNAKLPVLHIEKETVPPSEDIHFTYSGAFSGLLEHGEVGTVVLDPGIYTVTELPLPDTFRLTDLSCDGDAVVNMPDRTITVDLAYGDELHCLFENTEDGSITITKEAEPYVDQLFNFTGALPASIYPGTSVSLTHLVPGAYNVSEVVPPGWDLAEIWCNDGDSDTPSVWDLGSGNVTFNVDAGEDVECVFLNLQKGTIIVEKHTVPYNLSGNFSFMTNFGPDFNLSHGQNATFHNVSSGEYWIEELLPGEAFELIGVECQGDRYVGTPEPDERRVEFVLPPGGEVTCHFYNAKTGTLIVEKVTVPENLTARFNLTLDYEIDFSLGHNESIRFENVSLGYHTIVEHLDHEGAWDVLFIECESDGDYEGDDYQSSGREVHVGINETVTCTFYNQERGHLIIEKQTDPDGEDQEFMFHVVAFYSCEGPFWFDYCYEDEWDEVYFQYFYDCDYYDDDFCIFQHYEDFLQDDDSMMFNVTPGQVLFYEDVPEGWKLESQSCAYANGTAVEIYEDYYDSLVFLSIAPGETIRCQVNNTKLPMLHIEKVAPDTETNFHFVVREAGFGEEYYEQNDWEYDEPYYVEFDLNHGEAEWLTLPVGNYTVIEHLYPPYFLWMVLCEGGPFEGIQEYEPGTNISLRPGDDVVCRWYNDIPHQGNGTLNLTKIIVNDDNGSLDLGGVSLLIDGNASVIGEQNVSGGFHLVSEVLLAGYNMTFDEESDCDSFGVVHVEPEGYAECVIINDDIRPKLIVFKIVINDAQGTAQPDDFIITVTGEDASPSEFEGDAAGTVVSLAAGAYAVTEAPASGYTTTFSPGCSGEIDVGQIVICTVTNNDVGPFFGGGGGGNPFLGQPLDDPELGDTDGDGYPDALEIAVCSDPLDANSIPNYDLSEGLMVSIVAGTAFLNWDPPSCGAWDGFLIWGSNSPWLLVARVDATTTTTSLPAAEGTKFKATYYYGDTVAGGNIVSDPEQLGGWKGDQYKQSPSAAPPPSSSPPAAVTSSGMSGWAIAGIIIGVTVLIGAIGAAGYLTRDKWMRR